MLRESKFDIEAFLCRVYVITLVLVIVALFLRPIPTENKEVLIATIAVISNGASLIVGYVFGSSKGSKAKTDALLNPNVKEQG